MLPDGVQTKLISEGRREELDYFLSHPGGPLLYFAREEKKTAEEEDARRKKLEEENTPAISIVTTTVQLVPAPS